MCVCVRLCLCTRICVCVHVFMGAHLFVCVLMSACVCAYVSVPQRLQQQQQDGLEVLVPQGQAVLPGQLQQVHQRPFALLRPLVVIGQLLEQVRHQLRVVRPSWGVRDRGETRCWTLVQFVALRK